MIEIDSNFAPNSAERFFTLLTLTNGSYYNQNGFFMVTEGSVRFETEL